MEIVAISLSRPQAGAITRALDVLKAGGVVAYPTDTAYGLAVDATNEEAIGKIFVMKKRAQKPLPVIVDSDKMVRRYATVDDRAAKYLTKYWPGPVTFVLPCRQALPTSLTVGLQTLAMRMVDVPIARAIVRGLGKPITCTSANLSGAGVLYSGQEVVRHFQVHTVQPDLVLDAGDIPENPLTTIVDLSMTPPVILRQGSVQIKGRNIRNVLKTRSKKRV
jgi:L-threonylcarbamoyladenylate synthase